MTTLGKGAYRLQDKPTMDLGELAVTLTELEVEIAWTEKDLTNAEQNDNPTLVYNLRKRLKELYRLLEEKTKTLTERIYYEIE